MTPLVEILSGDLSGRSYEMDDDEFVIGRSPTCDLVIPKRYISRRHARIVREGGHFVIDGLSEKNPVRVGRRAIREHLLSDGDEFEFCGIRFRFHLPSTRSGPSESGLSPAMTSGPRAAGLRRSGPHSVPPPPLGVEDADEAEDSWRAEDAAEDSWRTEEPAEDSWRAAEPGEDSWRANDADPGEGSWRDGEESFPPPGGSRALHRSTPGQVVFEVDEESASEERTSEIPAAKLESLSSRDAAGPIGEESSSERTAELGKRIDPDDPAYDPFAQVDDAKAKEKKADPAKEKLLRILSIVGLVGIALAILIQHQLQRKGPPELHEVEEPIKISVGQTLLFEEPWPIHDPPRTSAQTRYDGNPEEGDFLIKDSYAEVEVLVPHIRRRTVLLIRGVSEGETYFQLKFPESNRIKMWKVMVEGDDPHNLARDKRREALGKKPATELLQLLRDHMRSGETLSKERESLSKEGYYYRAYQEFRKAVDTALALAGKPGYSNRKIRELVKRCEDAETKAREDMEKFVDRQVSLYESLVRRNRSQEEIVKQLRRVLRSIGHSCDARFKRFHTLLVDGWSAPFRDEIQKCEHDSKPG